MCLLGKSAIMDTLITQESNRGMGGVSKTRVKQEGETEVGSSITSDMSRQFPTKNP